MSVQHFSGRFGRFGKKQKKKKEEEEEEFLGVVQKEAHCKLHSQKTTTNLGQFRNELADALRNMGSTKGSKIGRRSNAFLDEELQAKKQKGPSHPFQVLM
ncbi:unnamed protein product [Danaus chrysippus]|uniref:(African queen) hypothetical protein n=1 Tax=Danaus chrysippus TaxID=151541 RepID=A0A8J2W607_9NEOP|nr:unnamed protein product [Danaus chrysippus]